MKILYCIAGNGYYGVLRDDVLNMQDEQNLSQTGLIIKAKRVFSLEVSSS